MTTVVAADLTFELVRADQPTVHGHLTGRDSRLELEIDDPGAFAGAGDASTVRTAAAGLADRGLRLRVVHQGRHLVTLGAVSVPWWQRRVTGSPHLRLGSLRGAWTAARSRVTRQPPALPSERLAPPTTLWPPAPTFMRRPVRRVTTTHDQSRGGAARLVLVKGDHWDGEQQPIFWLEEETAIGSSPECGIRLPGLEPVHARLVHDPADEWRIVEAEGEFRVGGASAPSQLLRTGSRVEIGDHVLAYRREEYADHGRPYGGRVGGELGHQRPQPPRRPPTA